MERVLVSIAISLILHVACFNPVEIMALAKTQTPLPTVILVHVHLVLTVLNVNLIFDLVKKILAGIMVSFLSFFSLLNCLVYVLGQCNETSNTTFVCSCEPGWEGIHCEIQINFCRNITCQNNGICRPLFLNYSCECLSESYSGHYCEITANKIIGRQIASKTFGYIAILALIVFAMFILVLDLLKYWFGIDPVGEELERMRQEKQAKKRKPPVVIRYIYVNAPLPQTTTRPASIIEETSV